jgi:hypothetical protein
MRKLPFNPDFPFLQCVVAGQINDAGSEVSEVNMRVSKQYLALITPGWVRVNKATLSGKPGKLEPGLRSPGFIRLLPKALP